MARLSDRAEHALNETRMLVLGAQVLVGFDFQATFQPAFDRLPVSSQHLKLVGLALMLVAVGLLIVPGPFHQIVEGGKDTERLVGFTSWAASAALLPFALGIGLELYIATQVVVGERAAVVFGIAGTAFAVFFWYALDLLWRRREPQPPRVEHRLSEHTSLTNRIKQVLTEARVVLPGAQALLGFQLAAVLTDAFSRLPTSSQYTHLASLVLMAISIVLLMAPAAFHRIVERGDDSERLHRFASAMVLAALVPLGLGMAGELYVVVAKVLNSGPAAICLAVVSLVFFFGLWFGVTLAVRAKTETASSELRVSQAAR